MRNCKRSVQPFSRVLKDIGAHKRREFEEMPLLTETVQ